jgi:CelD/BcsL family acetyltransferase involved in cellulose biosynthesis
LGKTILASTPGELECLRPAWDALYRAGDYTLFQSFRWNYLAARAFHTHTIRVVYRERQGSAALVPAAVEGGRLGLIGEALFDYRDVLSSGDPGVIRDAWGQLSHFGLGFWFQALRGGSHLRQWRALGFELQPFASAPQVRRAECSADEFTSRHTRVARLLRRMQRAGAELRRYSGSASALVRSIYQRKAQQSLASGESLFADPARVEFMIAVSAAHPAACEIFALESGASLIAALVCFRDGGTRRFYTINYDPRWSGYSPGTVLLFEVTRQSLAEGLDCDYMTGEQPHKLRFATSCEPLFRVCASSERLRQIVYANPAA